MRKQLILALALMGGMTIAAEAQGRYDDRGYGRGYGNNDRDFGRNGRFADPVRATINTLYSVEQRARVDNHERNHMRNAVEKLTRFDMNRQRGRFDQGALESAMRDLRDLAQADQLHPRDRSRIAAHLNDLYRMRGGGRW
jgi:hypothetical protein